MTTPASQWFRPEFLVGEVLEGRYVLVRFLGKGGMGAVFEARHARLDRRVAVKILYPGLAVDERQRKRFLREARATNRIASKHVVEILDFGDQGTTFFVMEFLEGQDLAARIREQGKLPWKEAQPILLQVADALAAAHREGIIHRDVKPSNVFLAKKKNGTHCAKVLDFGIAKVAESSQETAAVTKTDEVIGTAAYMAPEQVLGEPVDARTDIYAFGIMMFKTLTDSIPFGGANQYQILEQQVRVAPPPIRRTAPEVPEAVAKIVEKALAKRPEDRFQSVDELVGALLAAGVDEAGSPIRETIAEAAKPRRTRALPDLAFAPTWVQMRRSSERSQPPRQFATVPLGTEILPRPPRQKTLLLGDRPEPGQAARGAPYPASTSPSQARPTVQATTHFPTRQRAWRAATAVGALGLGLTIGAALLTGHALDRCGRSSTDSDAVRSRSSTHRGGGGVRDASNEGAPSPVGVPQIPASEQSQALERDHGTGPVDASPEVVVAAPPPVPPLASAAPEQRPERMRTKPAIARDGAVLRRLEREARQSCDPQSPLRATFVIDRAGRAIAVSIVPWNPCVGALVSSASFRPRDRPSQAALDVPTRGDTNAATHR